MQLNEQNKQYLNELLSNPALAKEEDKAFLSELIEAYPFFQPLHLHYYEASKREENADFYLAKASLHNGGDLCFRLQQAPETLISSFPTTAAVDMKVVEEEAIEAEIPVVQEQEEEETFEEIEDLAPAVTAHKTDELTFISPSLPITTEPASAIETPVVPQSNPMLDDMSAHQRVSKYDDDNLPYTFLWWLAKTRKEHEQIFQPYVSQKKAEVSPSGELQHQIVEHIFHLQTPFDLEEDLAPIAPKKGALSKKDEIIENFIKNDPQIKAPKAELINTENKARKSAEDQDDLVSETLAAIYIEQMLYHKAIETYEKLSLKFPEKSRYFADLIQSLEKKI